MLGTVHVPKAAGTLALSQSSVNLSLENFEQMIHVTRPGNGDIRATANNANCEVEVIGDNILLRGAVTGNTTVTVSVGPGTNYTAAPSKTIAVTTTLPSKDLTQVSPADISKASKLRIAEKLWPVGSLTALVPIQGTAAGIDWDFMVRFRLIDHNHNEALEGGGTTSFLWAQDEAGNEIAIDDPTNYNTLLNANVEGICMNRKGQVGVQEPDSTLSSTAKANGPNKGGWAASYGRILCEQFYQCMPADWRNAICASKIYTDNVGYNNIASSISATEDMLYALSQVEMFGSVGSANQNSIAFQRQMAWFKAGNSKIAKRLSNPTEAAHVFGRDPHRSSTSIFCGVTSAGGNYLFNAAGALSLRPAFKI